jgi:hypothetical protein
MPELQKTKEFHTQKRKINATMKIQEIQAMVGHSCNPSFLGS